MIKIVININKINKIINRYQINKFQINKFQNNKMSDKVINIYKIINKHTIINQKINHNNIIVKNIEIPYPINFYLFLKFLIKSF